MEENYVKTTNVCNLMDNLKSLFSKSELHHLHYARRLSSFLQRNRVNTITILVVAYE